MMTHTKNWMLPSLAALLVAAIAVVAAVWSAHGHSPATGYSSTETLNGDVVRLLEDNQFTVESMPQPNSEADRQKAVDAAIDPFNFVSSEQVTEVVLAQVGSKLRNYDPAPTWVVYLAGVKVPSFGGDDEDLQAGPMVVLVDPESFKYEWAIQ